MPKSLTHTKVVDTDQTQPVDGFVPPNLPTLVLPVVSRAEPSAVEGSQPSNLPTSEYLFLRKKSRETSITISMPHLPPLNRPRIGTAPPKNPLLVTLAPTLAISDPIDLENNYHTSKTSIIPTTNNAIEQVIRVFTQHHSTFCGFENIESARLYLGVFEKAYRFTPFSDDARERIRGKCPLELAGYHIQELPMAQLLRGLALHCSTPALPNLVPDV